MHMPVLKHYTCYLVPIVNYFSPLDLQVYVYILVVCDIIDYVSQLFSHLLLCALQIRQTS
jgi:hypothetical protein